MKLEYRDKQIIRGFELEALAKKLKKIRKYRGLTQKDVAALTSLRQAEISKIENGKIDLRYTSLVAIAAALQVTMEFVPFSARPFVNYHVRRELGETVKEFQPLYSIDDDDDDD